MPREILEITPSGGMYCLVDLKKSVTIPPVFNCAKPAGFLIQEILQENRASDDFTGHFFTDGDVLRWAFGRICRSPMARALAHDARFDNWMVLIQDGEESSGRAVADPNDLCLYIPRYAESIAVLSRSPAAKSRFLFELVKGLRQIWQENSHIFDAHALEPGEYIKLARFVDADGDMCATLSAYQMRETGDHDAWRYILSCDLHPLAVTLSECLDFDKSADAILETLGFVFQDWFADEARLSRIDRLSLSELDIRADFEFGHEDVSFEALLKLSMLPEGFSYLEYSAAEIMCDSYYSRMPDDINMAHLKQITRESQIQLIEEIGFRDTGLARKFFPNSTFETVA